MGLILKCIWEGIQIAGWWIYGLYLRVDIYRLTRKLKRLYPVWWEERQSKVEIHKS